MNTPRPFRKIAFIGLALFAILYVATGFYLKSLAGRSLYVDRPPTYQIGGDYFLLPSADGTKFAAIYLPNPVATFTVLYLHGNGDELGSARPFVDDLRAHGYAVMAIDYRGYGRSEGKATEQGVNEDAYAALVYLRDVQKVPLNRVIVLGYSLGGAPAIDIAARERIGGLALQAAYTTVFSIKSEFLAHLFAPFDFNKNYKRIHDVRSPVLIMHGTVDPLIPKEHGYRLYAEAQAPKKAMWFSGVPHSPFVQSAGAAYWRALEEFSASILGVRKAEPGKIKP